MPISSEDKPEPKAQIKITVEHKDNDIILHYEWEGEGNITAVSLQFIRDAVQPFLHINSNRLVIGPFELEIIDYLYPAALLCERVN